MVWLMERLATMRRMKGFGFIEFETAEAAAKCLCAPLPPQHFVGSLWLRRAVRLCREWNGQDYMGRTLTMNIAEEKPGHAGGSPKWKEGPSEKPVRQPEQNAPHRLPTPRPQVPVWPIEYCL